MNQFAKLSLVQVILFGSIMFGAAVYAEANEQLTAQRLEQCYEAAEAGHMIAASRSLSFQQVDQLVERDFPLLDSIARAKLIESVMSSSWSGPAIRRELMYQCTSAVLGWN